MKTYTLIGADGRSYESPTPGTLGGHLRLKGYGRLDCPSAVRWIAKGHYVQHRVFFADEATAIAAGYRPCAVCMPERYREWKSARRRDGETARRRDGKTARRQVSREPCVVRRAPYHPITPSPITHHPPPT